MIEMWRYLFLKTFICCIPLILHNHALDIEEKSLESSQTSSCPSNKICCMDYLTTAIENYQNKNHVSQTDRIIFFSSSSNRDFHKRISADKKSELINCKKVIETIEDAGEMLNTTINVSQTEKEKQFNENISELSIIIKKLKEKIAIQEEKIIEQEHVNKKNSELSKIIEELKEKNILMEEEITELRGNLHVDLNSSAENVQSELLSSGDSALTQIVTLLSTCSGNLAVCKVSETSLQGNLNSCNLDFNNCKSDLNTCNSNYTACTIALLDCNGSLDTCKEKHVDRIDNSDNFNVRQDTTPDKLKICEEDLVTCNIKKTNCDNTLNLCKGKKSTPPTDLGTCQKYLIKCKSNLATKSSDLDTCNTNLATQATDLVTCDTKSGVKNTPRATCEELLINCERNAADADVTIQRINKAIEDCATHYAYAIETINELYDEHSKNKGTLNDLMATKMRYVNQMINQVSYMFGSKVNDDSSSQKYDDSNE